MAIVVAELQALLTANTSQFTAALAAATAQTKTFAQKSELVGKALTKFVSLPLIAVGAAAVMTAVKFEDALTSIQALVGLSAAEVDGFRGSVLGLAGETARAPQELGEALYFVTSSGFAGAEALDVVEAAARAAAAGLGTTADIADAVTSAVTAYGAETLSASAATDVLTATVRTGKVEAAELSGVIGRIIPIASTLGVEFDEVGAAIAVMSLAGLDAAEATTALRGIFSAIVSPSQDAEKAFASMGLSMEEVRRIIGDEGLLAFLQMLEEQTGGNVEEMARLFPEIRGLTGALNILGTDAATVERIFSEVQDSAGDTAAAFDVVSESAGFKMTQALVDAQVALVAIGDVLIPVVTTILTAMASLASAFSGLPSPISTAVVIAALFVAVLGPLIALVVSSTTAIVKLGGALWTLAATNPVVAALAVTVAVLAAAFLSARVAAAKAQERADTLASALIAGGNAAAEATAEWREFDSALEASGKTLVRAAGQGDEVANALQGYADALLSGNKELSARAEAALAAASSTDALTDAMARDRGELDDWDPMAPWREQEIEKMREEIERTTEAIRAQTGVMSESAKMSTVLRVAQEELVEVLLDETATAEDLAAAKQAVIDAASGQAVVQAAVNEATQAGVAAGEDLAVAEGLVAEAADTATTATEALTVAQEAAETQANNYRDALFGVREATRSVEEAQWALFDAQVLLEAARAAGGAASRGYAEAENDAERAVDAVAAAGLDAAANVAALYGAQLTAAQAATAQRDALALVRDDIAEGSPLRAYIDSLIADLDALITPRSGTVEISILTGYGGTRTLGAGGSLSGFAHGLIATTPTLGVFGEGGPEALVPLGTSVTASRDRMGVMADAGLLVPSGGGDGITVAQTNHFHGADMPTVTQLEAQNRKLGIRVANTGRRG